MTRMMVAAAEEAKEMASAAEWTETREAAVATVLLDSMPPLDSGLLENRTHCTPATGG